MTRRRSLARRRATCETYSSHASSRSVRVGVTVEFGSTIDVQTNALVLAFAATVEGAAIPGVLDVVPTYCAVTIYFNPLCTDAAALTDQLLSLINTSSPAAETIRTTHRIPVCYGGDCGTRPDRRRRPCRDHALSPSSPCIRR